MIDVHAHMYKEDILGDVSAVIERFTAEGGTYIINSAADLSSSHDVIAQAIEFPELKPAVGLHPELVVPGTDIFVCGIDEPWIETNIAEIRGLLKKHAEIAAVGECGLDYYWIKRERLGDREDLFDIEKKLFIEQVILAQEFNLPLIIHCRDEDGDKQAEAEVLDLLVRYGPSVKCLFHSYTGSLSYLEDILGLGAYVSFNGIVTYKNADNVRAILHEVPLDRLMIETDSPWLVPHRHRSVGIQVCEPMYVKEIAHFVAEEKGVTVERLWKQVEENSEKLFGPRV